MALEPQTLQECETPVENSTGVSLLELAEVLDQHRIWVETAGESGARADLCGADLSKADLTGINLQGASLHRANLSGADLSMANLRGASLVQADMHDTNLLGTELRGANLMGANLYGAEGVWSDAWAGPIYSTPSFRKRSRPLTAPKPSPMPPKWRAGSTF